MNLSNPIKLVVPLTVLRQTRKFKFQHISNELELAELTQILRIKQLKRFSFQGQVIQLNKNDYILRVSFNAILVQLCIISLKPIKTKINHKINQFYTVEDSVNNGNYISFGYDSVEKEHIKSEINVGDIVLEALSLEVPLYPKKKNVKFDGITITESEIKPLEKTINRPFLSLKEFELINKIKKN